MPRLFCSHFLSFIWLQNSVNVCQSHWIDFWGELNLCKSLAACLSSGWSETVHSWCWRGLWELLSFFFFLSRLGSRASEQHPPLWMFESAIQLQCANRWHSDKWWLGLFLLGLARCTWVFPQQSGRETCCLGQLMFLWAKAIQLLSCVCSCACV